jgi:hypothetical protein
MSQKGIDAHEVIHVGMADENRLDLLQHPLGQVMKLSAIEQQAAAQWPDLDQQHRIVEQAGEKDGFQVTEQTGSLAHTAPLLF